MAGRLMAPSPGGTDNVGGLPDFGHCPGIYGGCLAISLESKKPLREGVQLLQTAVESSKPVATEDKDQDQRWSSRASNVKLSSSFKANRDRIPMSKLAVDRRSKCKHNHAFDAKWLGASVVFEEVRTKTEEDAVKARLAVRDTAIEWKKLNHYHILRLWGYCDEDTPAFVYERTSGQTLSEFVRDHPEMLWPKLRELIIAALFLKKHGLIVDAVTPEDILIGLDKRVKMAGFHRLLALRLDSGTVSEAHGALQFVAPERVGVRDAPPTPEGFVFSLGMCVVDALRASGDASSVSIESEQQEIVERMCHADPSKRASLSEVFSAFERFGVSIRESKVEPEPKFTLARPVAPVAGAHVDEQPQQQVDDPGGDNTTPLDRPIGQTNVSPKVTATREHVEGGLKIQDTPALETSGAAGLTPLTVVHECEDLDSVRDPDNATDIRDRIEGIADVDDAGTGEQTSLALFAGIGKTRGPASDQSAVAQRGDHRARLARNRLIHLLLRRKLMKRNRFALANYTMEQQSGVVDAPADEGEDEGGSACTQLSDHIVMSAPTARHKHTSAPDALAAFPACEDSAASVSHQVKHIKLSEGGSQTLMPHNNLFSMTSTDAPSVAGARGPTDGHSAAVQYGDHSVLSANKRLTKRNLLLRRKLMERKRFGSADCMDMNKSQEEGVVSALRLSLRDADADAPLSTAASSSPRVGRYDSLVQGDAASVRSILLSKRPHEPEKKVPRLRVLAPAGAGLLFGGWERGQPADVRWEPLDKRVRFVRIDLCNESWTAPTTIAYRVPNDGAFRWRRVYWGMPIADGYFVNVYDATEQTSDTDELLLARSERFSIVR